MLELALGWLRWPPDQALRTDVNLIDIAIRGDVKRAEAMSGNGKKLGPRPLDIREFVRDHNDARRRAMAGD